MDMKLHLEDVEHSKIDVVKFQKMVMLYNAVEQGWTVKKRKDAYVFSKGHEGKKEVYEESYLKQFMKATLDYDKILS